MTMRLNNSGFKKEWKNTPLHVTLGAEFATAAELNKIVSDLLMEGKLLPEKGVYFRRVNDGDSSTNKVFSPTDIEVTRFDFTTSTSGSTILYLDNELKKVPLSQSLYPPPSWYTNHFLDRKNSPFKFFDLYTLRGSDGHLLTMPFGFIRSYDRVKYKEDSDDDHYRVPFDAPYLMFGHNAVVLYAISMRIKADNAGIKRVNTPTEYRPVEYWMG